MLVWPVCRIEYQFPVLMKCIEMAFSFSFIFILKREFQHFFSSVNNELLSFLKICVPEVHPHPRARRQDLNASRRVRRVHEQQSYTGCIILH
jgi:hypothetical protein